MPTLHELFDAASGDLPPLPDLAPSTRRIVRRRQLAARTSAAVLSSALVIGAGTFALSVQHSGNARDAAGSPPQSYSDQYVLDTLRGLWPDKNEQLRLANAGGIIVSRNNRTVALLTFQVLADVDKFPQELTCSSWDKVCRRATTGDGDEIIVRTGDAMRYSAPPLTSSPSPSPSSSLSADPRDAFSLGSGPVGAVRRSTGSRLHGTYFGELTMTDPGDGQPADQLLDVVESPAYERLIESAVAASSLGWLGTPPAGIPSDATSYGPSPSTSAG